MELSDNLLFCGGTFTQRLKKTTTLDFMNIAWNNSLSFITQLCDIDLWVMAYES